MDTSTIAAIATPVAASGIGIVRMSGPRALDIAAQMIRPMDERRSVAQMRGYTALLGRAFDEDGEIDDVVLIAYRAPKSYTGEDTAELSCHGGVYLLRRILRRCYTLGAQPAGAGEFTRRAFTAGKISLTQAEAVAGLIASQGRQQAAAALSARDGAVFNRIRALRGKLVSASAALSAYLDYPEEDQQEISSDSLLSIVSDVSGQLEKMLGSYDTGTLISSGIRTVILGKPNVGKSTLMNLLSGEEKSIVTKQAGTTRDVIESVVNLSNVRLCLWDTAGIRETVDPVEAAGVSRSWEKLDRAQLVLLVLDASEPLGAEDESILQAIRDLPCIAVWNKMDLQESAAEPSIMEMVREKAQRMVSICAKDGTGLEALEQAVMEVMRLTSLDEEGQLLINERQRRCVQSAYENLLQAAETLRGGMMPDAAHICLDSAIQDLLNLTGEQATQAIVDEVFSSFCVGK